MGRARIPLSKGHSDVTFDSWSRNMTPFSPPKPAKSSLLEEKAALCACPPALADWQSMSSRRKKGKAIYSKFFWVLLQRMHTFPPTPSTLFLISLIRKLRVQYFIKATFLFKNGVLLITLFYFVFIIFLCVLCVRVFLSASMSVHHVRAWGWSYSCCKLPCGGLGIEPRSSKRT